MSSTGESFEYSGGARPPLNSLLPQRGGPYPVGFESDLGSTVDTMHDARPSADGDWVPAGCAVNDGWWGAYSRRNDKTKLRTMEILGSKSVTVLNAVA